MMIRVKGYEQAKREVSTWHLWFAWHLIRTDDGEMWVWLDYVWRWAECPGGFWHYRLRNPLEDWSTCPAGPDNCEIKKHFDNPFVDYTTMDHRYCRPPDEWKVRHWSQRRYDPESGQWFTAYYAKHVLKITFDKWKSWDKVKEFLPCPFCGRAVDEDDLSDTLYPSGIYWREDGGVRHYISHKDHQDGDMRCWSMNCPQSCGGCGAEITADSELEAKTKWNNRVEEARW